MRSPFVFVLALAALSVAVIGTAAGTAAAAATLAFPPYAPGWLLATGPSAQQSAQNTGDFSVWEDDAAGDWNVVYGRPGATSVLPAGTSAQRHPAVWGSVIAYEDDRAGDWDLYAWQTDPALVPAASSPESPVASGAGDQRDPAISGSLVVYEDTSRGNADIVLHDLAAGVTRRLTGNTAPQADPSIDGVTVVWADRRNGDWDIYAYDLSADRLRRLTTSKADQTRPQVGQGKVVYQDRRNGHWDIYEYDLRSGRERRLTTDNHDQTAPWIDRDPAPGRAGTVVYQDDRADAGDIYVREGRTGISKRVCGEAGAQTQPSYDAEHLAWTDARAGQPDVYGCRLLFPILSARASAATPAYNASVRVVGELTLPDDFTDSHVIKAVAGSRSLTGKAAGDGDATAAFSIPLGRIQRKLTVRVWYPGSATQLPAGGGTVVFKPTALLSRPSLVKQKLSGITTRRVYTVSGTLRPRHAAGSKAVTLLVYRKSGVGVWKVYRTLRVAVRNSSTASTYRTQVSMDRTYLTSYLVVAVHDDADHTRTESPQSRVIGTDD
jgi:beta propeller repeat protein